MISFTVHGTPQPQGSTRAFTPKGWKRPVLTSANKNLKPWRQDAAQMALEAMKGRPVTEDAVSVTADFYFAKPKSTPKRVAQKITKPDCDKLLRASLDAMTGIVYRDDSQVVQLVGRKRFGLPERAEISVTAL